MAFAREGARAQSKDVLFRLIRSLIQSAKLTVAFTLNPARDVLITTCLKSASLYLHMCVFRVLRV